MNVILKLVRKSETNEWIVRVRVDGQLSEGSTYYTDDKNDALDTLVAMRQEYQSLGHSVTVKPTNINI